MFSKTNLGPDPGKSSLMCAWVCASSEETYRKRHKKLQQYISRNGCWAALYIKQQWKAKPRQQRHVCWFHAFGRPRHVCWFPTMHMGVAPSCLHLPLPQNNKCFCVLPDLVGLPLNKWEFLFCWATESLIKHCTADRFRVGSKLHPDLIKRWSKLGPN